MLLSEPVDYITMELCFIFLERDSNVIYSF